MIMNYGKYNYFIDGATTIKHNILKLPFPLIL